MAKSDRYLKKNDAVIEKRFNSLLVKSDKTIEVGLRKLLQAAVDFALESHDSVHQLHLKYGDTYGWMIVHNGSIVDIAVIEGEKMRHGDTARQLEAMATSVSNSGWVGVLMAGMNHPNYYAVDYENDILNSTIRMTPVFFKKYFKPL